MPSKGERKRNWLFTCFMLEKADFWAQLTDLELADMTVIYLCCQHEECPTTKKKHLQGYVEFSKSYARSQVQKLLGIPKQHCEARKGSRHSAREYCLKEDNEETRSAHPKWFNLGDKGCRLPGTTPVEKGTWRDKAQGDRTKLAQIYSKIKGGAKNGEILEEFPDEFIKFHRGIAKVRATLSEPLLNQYIPDMQIVVYWGPTRSKKTSRVFSENGPENCYKPVYSKEKFWFDNYSGQRVLLIDEFIGQLPFSYMQGILDHYHQTVQVKGACVTSMWTKIYITSNISPHLWYNGWLDVPQGVQDSFIERITEVIECKRARGHKRKTWGDLGVTTAVPAPLEVLDEDNMQPRVDQFMDARMACSYVKKYFEKNPPQGIQREDTF